MYLRFLSVEGRHSDWRSSSQAVSASPNRTLPAESSTGSIETLFPSSTSCLGRIFIRRGWSCRSDFLRFCPAAFAVFSLAVLLGYRQLGNFWGILHGNSA